MQHGGQYAGASEHRGGPGGRERQLPEPSRRWKDPGGGGGGSRGVVVGWIFFGGSADLLFGRFLKGKQEKETKHCWGSANFDTYPKMGACCGHGL